MSDDEFDNIPDAFADVTDVDWLEILSAPARMPQPLGAVGPMLPGVGGGVGEDTHATQRSDSSGYFDDDDDLEADALAQIDAIERQATQVVRREVGEGYQQPVQSLCLIKRIVSILQ